MKVCDTGYTNEDGKGMIMIASTTNSIRMVGFGRSWGKGLHFKGSGVWGYSQLVLQG